MSTLRSEASKAHMPVFPSNGMTHCSCGKPSVKTYAGWKRHASAEKRKSTREET